MQIDEHGTITASKYSNKTLKNNKWGHYEIHLFTQMYMWNLQTADYIHSVVEVVEDFRLVKTIPIKHSFALKSVLQTLFWSSIHYGSKQSSRDGFVPTNAPKHTKLNLNATKKRANLNFVAGHFNALELSSWCGEML